MPMFPVPEGNLRTASSEQSTPPSRKQGFANGGSCVDARPPHSIPCRRHTLGGRAPQEQAALKPPHMERKRAAFLEHLKQRYPHHASTIMGHQDCLQEQVGPAPLPGCHGNRRLDHPVVMACWERFREWVGLPGPLSTWCWFPHYNSFQMICACCIVLLVWKVRELY